MAVRVHVGKLMVRLAAAFVLVATLYPSDQPGSTGPACLICGDRGVADAIVNVWLFMPLGAAIAWSTRSAQRALLTCLLLSGAVEAAQLFVVPGRDASIGDLLFNTAGGAAGVLLARGLPALLNPPPARAARLSLAAGLFACVVVAATGWLFVPAPTRVTYYVAWKPELAHLETFPGDVLAATIQKRPLLPGRADPPDEIRSLLIDRAPLQLSLRAGHPTTGLAGLVTIHDERQREIMLAGADHEDLVFRVRTRAAALRLDHPEIRGFGTLKDLRPGQQVLATVQRNGREFCIGISGALSCGEGPTAGSGWGFFLFIEEWPRWLRIGLNAGWTALLAFSVGLWFRPRRASWLACVLLVTSLLVVPRLVGLRDTPPLEWLSALASLGVGLVVSSRIVTRHSRDPALAA